MEDEVMTEPQTYLEENYACGSDSMAKWEQLEEDED